MEFLLQLITNRLFISVVLTTIIAQIAKTVVVSVKHRKFDLSMIGTTGGMPSSHTAVVIALTAGIYYEQGLTSLTIAAGVFAVIVIHDAVTWRRAIGFQSETINNLVRKLNVKHQKKLKELLGHNIPEAVAGLILGWIIAYLTYAI